MTPRHRGRSMNTHAYDGLSHIQKAKIKTELEKLGILKARHAANRAKGDNPAEGWFIFRQPTTVHPPRFLALHRRDRNGRLCQVVWITQDGVTEGEGE